LLSVFVNIVLPVVIVIAWGYLLERRLAVDVRSVSRICFYAFSPCLVFSSLSKSTLGGTDAARIAGFVFSVALCMWLLATLVARTLHLSQVQESAFLLVTIFNNTGNYGLPVLLFAFGQPGLERGLIFFVASAFVTNTFGVYLASRGRMDVRTSLRQVLGVPVFYAVVLALFFNATGLNMPEPVSKAVKLLGDASVPTLELVLGMQLARTSLQRDLRLTGLATFMALVVSAGLAFVFARVWGLQGLSRQVCILETAMPTAVMTTALATEYDADPGFVTNVVLMTTLASTVTVTVLLRILM